MCGSDSYNLLLAGLWLRLEGCQLVGLLATSIKQQATGSKGDSNVIMPEVTQGKVVLQESMGQIEASCRHRQGLAPSTSTCFKQGLHTVTHMRMHRALVGATVQTSSALHQHLLPVFSANVALHQMLLLLFATSTIAVSVTGASVSDVCASPFAP